jgi:phage replication O-like protein O
MSTIKPFLKQGNFTVVNNFIIDHMMPNLSANAFKMLMFAIRKTIGWHKDADRISYSQFMESTGIRSRSTVSRALDELMDAGYILRFEVGKHKRTGKPLYSYALNTEYEVEANSPEIGLLENSNSPKIGLLNSPKIGLFNSPEIGLTKDIKTNKHSDGDDHDDREEVLNTLTAFGVATSVAMQLSKTCSMTLTEQWIEYAKSKDGLRNPAAFVVSRLRAGEQPPQTKREEEALTCPACYTVKHTSQICDDCGLCLECCQCE